MRITPAYAGTTFRVNIFIARIWDHPRLRGNYGLRFKLCANKQGSPPLTRELLNRQLSVWSVCRITPAYAGTTLKCLVIVKSRWDHPRLRGNYIALPSSKIRIRGSPPLTRELQDIVPKGDEINRITPAYAGTT